MFQADDCIATLAFKPAKLERVSAELANYMNRHVSEVSTIEVTN